MRVRQILRLKAMEKAEFSKPRSFEICVWGLCFLFCFGSCCASINRVWYWLSSFFYLLCVFFTHYYLCYYHQYYFRNYCYHYRWVISPRQQIILTSPSGLKLLPEASPLSPSSLLLYPLLSSTSSLSPHPSPPPQMSPLILNLSILSSQ